MDELELTQPISTPALIRHRNHVLSHMENVVPPVNPPATGIMPGMTAQEFQALVIALSSGHAAPAPAASVSTETAIQKRWNVNRDTLLKLTHSADEADLSSVWGALAKGPKKEERGILEAALREQARSPNAATTTSLIVSKELYSTIVNLTFWSGDPDNLNTGLQPFRASYTSTAQLRHQLTLPISRPTISSPPMASSHCRTSTPSSKSLSQRCRLPSNS